MAIHRKKAKPPHNYPHLADALAGFLDPKKKDAKGKGIPEIYEEEQAFGNNMVVRVIWDKWRGVPHSERAVVILDAYRKARGELEMLRISRAKGIHPTDDLDLDAFRENAKKRSKK